MLPVVRLVKYGAANGLTAVLLGSVALFGCSFNAASKGANLSLVVPNQGSHSLLSFGSGPRVGLAPAAWNTTGAGGFACYGVNVIGPGIADSSLNPKAPVTDFSALIAGTKACAYRGVVSDVFALPTGGGEVVINLQVPPGAGRVVQLIGITNASFCNGSFFQPISGSTPGAYEIGHTVADLFGDATLTIPITYAAVESQRVDCVNGSPATVLNTPIITYSGSTVFTINAAISPLSVSNAGGAITSCTVSPALPAGLTLNSATCVISGTPTVLSAVASYTVTASSTDGPAAGVAISITVNDVVPVISYTGSPFTFVKGTVITSLSAANSGGGITGCSVAPALPSGLTLSSATCMISGTPTAITGIANYTVTASNSGGAATGVVISITVNDVVPTISYTGSPFTFTQDSPITSLTPANTGGAITSCSVDIPLPAGLTFNTTTCMISGAPTAVTAVANYTVTASNTGGASAGAVISIVVNPDVPTLSYAGAAGTMGTVAVLTSVAPTTLLTHGASITGCGIKSGTTALPFFLSVHPTTCVISGTPTELLPPTLFTLEAVNSAGTSTSATITLSANGTWVWMNGSAAMGASGNYGTLNISGASTTPGARTESISWTDTAGKMWIFGGGGYDSIGSNNYLNDLWMFSPGTNQWTWKGGSNTALAAGTYGTPGVANSANIPGARSAAVSWYNPITNTVWLYGGTGSAGPMSDLWKYDLTTNLWTWMKGSSTPSETSNYGTIGTAGPSNTPGARYGASSWIDSTGTLWLFGGSAGSGTFNDLWKYNPGTNEWTWMSGANVVYDIGTYGTLGVPNAANSPSNRYYANTWTDASGSLWLFGGIGFTSGGGVTVIYNDLWKYSIGAGTWTWMKGASSGDQTGTYGVQGIANALNTPSSRSAAVSWTSPSGDLWIFGGNAAGFGGGMRNELWKYSPGMNKWTWIDGAVTAGTYNTMAIANSLSTPGGRQNSVAWTDHAGHLWLFGGAGYDNGNTYGKENDLWKYMLTKEIKAVGATTANNGAGGTTLVIAKPAGTFANRVMVAAITTRPSTTTITTPSGWTILQSQATGNITQSTYYRVATSADDAVTNYTWVLSVSAKASGVIITYDGVDPTAPVITSGGTATAASTIITAPTLSTGEAEFQSVTFFGVANDSAITTPAGYMGLGTDASTGGAVATRTRTLAADRRWTTSPAGGVTATGTSGDNVGQHILLKKAP